MPGSSPRSISKPPPRIENQRSMISVDFHGFAQPSANQQAPVTTDDRSSQPQPGFATALDGTAVMATQKSGADRRTL
ncbi:uncharacterized protein TrAtP1_006979 [Trichoderma atroviride]|uniref:uncharacterized protein n=1 Tax=Hypocrea atroviridis TaxID=63577 RepID=UPI003318BA40|nr:hypothetical protein TrAtP1_006979 [Trichoderma atroviride]